MDFLVFAPVFIFGSIIGSFLNVVIYRYNSGMSPLKGRSQCFACGNELSWYELIPVVSFIIQRARCAKCGVRLSWQYPAVEIMSGMIFVVVYALGKALPETIYLLIIFSTLLIIAVYDLRHKIIPDGLVAFFAILSLMWFLWATGLARAIHYPYYWMLVAGPMLFFPFWALWVVSHGKWLGLGDGKLALGIGWFLGASQGASAIMLAFWIGAAFALLMMAIQRIGRIKGNNLLSMQSEIPFGPFLILGTFIVYFTHINFFDGSINLFSFI